MAIIDEIRDILIAEPGLMRSEIRSRLGSIDPASLSGSISRLKSMGELDCIPVGNSNLFKYSWIDLEIEKPVSLQCVKWGGLPSAHSIMMARGRH